MVGLWRRLGGSKDGWIAMAVVMMLAADDAKEQMQKLVQNLGRFRLGKVYHAKTPSQVYDIDKDKVQVPGRNRFSPSASKSISARNR